MALVIQLVDRMCNDCFKLKHLFLLSLDLVDILVKNVDELGSEHHVRTHINEPPCYVLVCELQYKVGELHASECFNESTVLKNVSDVEIRMTRYCLERHCYFGKLRVEEWRCQINSSLPFEIIHGTLQSFLV